MVANTIHNSRQVCEFQSVSEYKQIKGKQTCSHHFIIGLLFVFKNNPVDITLYYPNLQHWLDLTEEFKDRRLLTRVVGAHFHQNAKLKTTINTSNRLGDLDLHLI